ncbi:cytochrome P450 [Mucidula mucida]|nr:cytochrome P450 [Mucidula mucida]
MNCRHLLSLFAQICDIFFAWLQHPMADRRRLPLPPNTSIKSSFRYRWEWYASISKRLGPIVSAPGLGATSVIVLNTAKAVTDLLDKNAAYASRPRWPMVELLGRQKNIGFTYYNDRLKKMRKVLQTSLSQSYVSTYLTDLFDDHSFDLCLAMSKSPDVYDVVQVKIKKLIATFSYGYEPDAAYLNLAETVAEQTGEAFQPGRWFVNSFPALMWIPGWIPFVTFQRWACLARQSYEEMVRTPFEKVKLAEEERNGLALVPRNLKSSQAISPDDEEILMYAAGSLFSAGTETLTTVIVNFLELIANHPEVQQEAYAEIVQIVGRNDLPAARHIEHLSFVQDVIKEVHRLHPAVPLVPHCNTTEQSYLGFRIPKKSWVMGNIWAVLHDESIYPDPDNFLPSRYRRDDSPDPRKFLYGFGRRRCPGSNFADQYLCLTIARIITLFEIFPAPDVHCPPVFTAGLVASVFP